MAKGHFITFEGGEGAGKSTQIARLAEVLRQQGRDVLVTREPGGSAGAEAVREVILTGAAEAYGPVMEALLFAAARSDHVEQVINPALSTGQVVLCDRYIDSSRVYQGTSAQLAPSFMRALEAVAVEGTVPDLTLILDLEPQEGMRRAAERRGQDVADRFEKEAIELHEIRREAYIDIARAEPERCVIIDAGGSEAEVASAILAKVAKVIKLPGSLLAVAQ